MKKSLLMIVALAALGLSACGGTQESVSSVTSTGEETSESHATGEIPTEDGKCTFVLRLGEGSVDFVEYETIYLTGGAFGWKTGYDAVALTNLAGTKTYFAQVDNTSFDVTADKGLEYQLVLGYNEKANMPVASSGLQWVDDRKSQECAAPGGLNNLSFTYEAGQLSVDLGTHTFSKSLPKPAAPLKNYSFVVNFARAVPEYGKVLIFGSFNGWNTPGDGKDNAKIISDAEMTPNDDRTSFKITFAEMVAGDYECKILVEYTTAVDAISWNTVDQTQENYAFTITQADGDGYELEILGENATFNLPDPNQKYEVRFEIVSSNDVCENIIYICGDFTDWTHVAFEENAYTGQLTGGNHEFGIMCNTDWSDKVCLVGGENLKVNIEGPCKVTVTFDFHKLVGESQEIDESAIVVDALVY